MSSEIEETPDHAGTSAGEITATDVSGGGVMEESMKNDVYTAAAYGDLDKLKNLVESEGASVHKPDDLGYRALQWAALNNRVAAAQYLLEGYVLKDAIYEANIESDMVVILNEYDEVIKSSILIS